VGEGISVVKKADERGKEKRAGKRTMPGYYHGASASASTAAAVAVLFLLIVQLFVSAQQQYTTTTATTAADGRHRYYGGYDNDGYDELDEEYGYGGEVQTEEDPKMGLRVMLHKDSLGEAPSCVHTFTQLELLNLVRKTTSVALEGARISLFLYAKSVPSCFDACSSNAAPHFFTCYLQHPTDDIVIHSIYTAPEETVSLLRSSADNDDHESISDSNKKRKKKNYGGLPQQIKISQLPSSSLSLGPNQVAIVPVSFLPRFPGSNSDSYNDNDDGGSRQHKRRQPQQQQQQQQQTTTADGAAPSPVTTESPQELDLQGWLGMPPSNSANQRRATNTRSIYPGSNRGSRNEDGTYQYMYQNERDVDEYELKTTLVVETNKGVLKLPFTASSVRMNEYGLPDTIHFPPLPAAPSASALSYDSEVVIGEDGSVNFRGEPSGSRPVVGSVALRPGIKLIGRSIRPSDASNSTVHDIEDNASVSPADCYDVYIRHPLSHADEDDKVQGMVDADNASGEDAFDLNSDMEVVEIFVSMPEHVSLSVIPEKDPNGNLLATARRQAIRSWGPGGGSDDGAMPLAIPPDDQPHYVASVCRTNGHTGTASSRDASAADRVSRDALADEYIEEISPLIEPSDGSTWLGYLLIRTDVDTLFIGLEELSAALEEEVEAGKGSQDSAAVPVGVPNVYTSGDIVEDDMTHEDNTRDVHILTSHPESIHIRMISSATASARVPIDIYNAGSSQPVTVMRMSAVWHGAEPGLDEKIGFDLKLQGKGLDQPIPIKLNETLEESFLVECSIDWDAFTKNVSEEDTVEVSGTIILRGSSRGMAYDEWEKTMKEGSSLDSDLVIEIPFSVEAIKAKVGFAVEQTSHPFPFFLATEKWREGMETLSSAFFPLARQSVRALVRGERASEVHSLKTMDYLLRVFSNVDIDLQVKSVEIRHEQSAASSSPTSRNKPLCSLFDVSFIRDGTFGDDLIKLRYQFPSDFLDNGVLEDGFIATCHLDVTTEPDRGDHSIPLILYSGMIDVTGSQSMEYGQNGALEESDATVWQKTVVGIHNLLAWLHSTKAGSALREALGSYSEKDWLGKYLSELALASANLRHSTFEPVLLQAGAIAQGEMETLPLFLTNNNPVPLIVSVDIGEIEGMSINLGREYSNPKGDGASFYDQLPGKSQIRSVRGRKVFDPLIEAGPYAGHPIDGLRLFLETDEQAATFFAQFPYRDAISLDTAVVARSPILERQFATYLVAKFHRKPVHAHVKTGLANRCNSTIHPPPYGSFEKKLTGKNVRGPVIISSDLSLSRRLPVCWDRSNESGENSIVTIPPAGVARFDVRIRSPSHSVLEKDITQFISTGLVLSTSHGEVLPVFVSFEALQGKLDVVHSVPTERDGVIRIRADLFENPSPPFSSETHLIIPPKTSRALSKGGMGHITTHNASMHGSGAFLYMESSFSRDVILRKFISCNPWFDVVLNSELVEDYHRGVNVGSVRSVVPCDGEDGLRSKSMFSHPSFFRCILSWLSNRADIQPRGCGLTSSKEKIVNDVDGNQLAERTVIERAIVAFQRALVVLEHAYGPHESFDGFSGDHTSAAFKSGLRSPDGVVPRAVVDIVADAYEKWNMASEFDLDSLSTNLRAIIEYNSTVGEALPSRTHVLSVALRNLAVESTLKVPKLFDLAKVHKYQLNGTTGEGATPSVIEFPPTRLADVSSLYIPVRNPTAVPIRVRLAVLPPKSTESDPEPLRRALGIDEGIQKRFSERLLPPFVQTKKAKQLDQKMASPDDWWDEVGGFVLANFEGDIIRSRHNVTIIAGTRAIVSLYNPSLLVSTAFMIGCGTRCGVRDDSENARRAWSPIGASAALGAILQGRKWSKKSQENPSSQGRRIFRAGACLHSGGAGPSPFAIPFSGLDELVIPPFGEAELGPVLFRPPGRFSTLACQAREEARLRGSCEAELFEAMVVLENSMSGLERVIVRGKGQIERVDFVDPIRSDGHESFGSVELRYGRSALVFPGTAQPLEPTPVLQEVVVLNSGDLPVRFLSASLSYTSRIRGTSPTHKNMCSLRNFRLLRCEELAGGFILLPGQNQSVVIEHVPDCEQRKDFISLYLEVDRSQVSPNSGRAYPSHKAEFFGLKSSRCHDAKHDAVSLSERVELLVGYDMSKKDYSSCVPAAHYSPYAYLSLTNHSSDFFAASDKLRGGNIDKRRRKISVLSILKMGAFVAIMVIVASTLGNISRSRMRTCNKYRAILNSSTKVKLNPKSPSISGSNWLAAFRCLARADPTSSDLQTLGREQARQILLVRFRSLGVLQPQCLTSTGAFRRERLGGIVSKTGRQTSTGGNERGKTLSDTTFRKFQSPAATSCGRLTCNLGWRTAVAKGIIHSNSLQQSPVVFKTESLLSRREQEIFEEDTSVEEDSGEDESISTGGESISSKVSTTSSANGGNSIEEDRQQRIPVDSSDAVSTSIPEATPVVKNAEVTSRNESTENGDIAQVDSSEKVGDTPGKAADGKQSNGTNIAPPKAAQVNKTESGRTGKVPPVPHVTRESPAKASQVETPSDDDAAKKRPQKQKQGVANAKISSAPKPTERYAATPSEPSKQKAVPTKSKKQETKITKSVEDVAISTNTGNKIKKSQDSSGKKERKKKVPKSERTKKGSSTEKTEKTSFQQLEKVGRPKKGDARTSEQQAFSSLSTLRPPPGIRPPPGFDGSQDGSPSTQRPIAAGLSAQNQTSLASLLPPPGTPDRDSFSAQHGGVSRTLSTDSADLSLGEALSSIHSTERTLPRIHRENQLLPPLAPLSGEVEPHGEEADFDIMDFLDGVLNDTSAIVDDDNDNGYPVLTGGGGLDVSDELAPIEDAGVPLIAANPWAAPTATTLLSEGKSRLVDYGITIEDTSERADGHNVNSLPPLLTPEILSSTMDMDPQDDDEGTGPVDFYSSILGGIS